MKLAFVHKLVCRVQLCRLEELRRGRLAADRDALADDRRDRLEARRDGTDICREHFRVRRDASRRLGGRELDVQRFVRLHALNRARRDAECAAAFRGRGRLECE